MTNIGYCSAIIVHITISGIMPRSVLTLRRNMNSEPSSHENLRDFNLRQSLWTNTQDRERLSISAPPLPRYWSYRLPFTLAGSRVVHASAAYLNLVHPASISSKSIWISPNSWDPLRPAMCKLSKIQGLWRLGPQSGLCHSGHQLFMVSGTPFPIGQMISECDQLIFGADFRSTNQYMSGSLFSWPYNASSSV